MGLSRQEHWSGQPLPPGDLPDSGIEPTSQVSPALAGRFFTTKPPGKPQFHYVPLNIDIWGLTLWSPIFAHLNLIISTFSLCFFLQLFLTQYLSILLLPFQFSNPRQYVKSLCCNNRYSFCLLNIPLLIFFAAKDVEALYSQQKQDQELTVAQIMNSLLPNSD